MSLEARNTFNSEEQRAKDVLQAIKTITPVISVIKEWGSCEKELIQVADEVTKFKKNISELRESLNIISDEFVRNTINYKIKVDSEELEKISSKKETLKKKCEKLENELIEYKKYAISFKDISDNIMEIVFKENSFENEDEFLAMIFIVLNIDSKFLDIRYHVQKYQASRWPNTFLLLSNGWAYMLQELKQNKI